MKIFMVRWKSICEGQMLRAMKALGIDVYEWTYPGDDADYSQEALDQLSYELVKDKFDYIFSVDFFPLVARVAPVAKIPYISWSVDCPVLQYYSKTLSLPYNRIFLFDYAMYQEYLPVNPDNIFYLPLAVDQPHYDEVIATITAEDRKRFSADVSFVGSLYTEKCAYDKIEGLTDYARGYAEGLVEAQLKVYGYNFLLETISDEFAEEFTKTVGSSNINEDYNIDPKVAISQMYLGEKVTSLERVRLLKYLSERFKVDLYTMSDCSMMPKINFRGKAESYVEMPKIFNLSKININPTSKTIRTGLPQRAWDILAAGGFMLTNYQEELPEFFTPGVEVETYGSFEECADKIAYYLEHEEERAAIAKAGHDKAKELHNYMVRFTQMFDMLK
ncbi:MAG: glycosyltransferase [Lachnospiraceae bacterium]|nr:glycosyltransferase [Lachnospiraceae bacterium]